LSFISRIRGSSLKSSRAIALRQTIEKSRIGGSEWWSRWLAGP
jgi:hypothetical protein